MPGKENKNEFGRLDRRSTLKLMSLALGGIFAIPLALSPLRKLRGRPTKLPDLPGEGSIFQPRRDDRLIRWEQQNH